MPFLKNLFRNLLILLVLGLAVYVFAPSVILQIANVLITTLFGPIALIIFILASLPYNHAKRRK